MRPILFIFAVAAGLAGAQDVTFPCQAPSPADEFFLLKQRIDSTPNRPKVGTLAGEFRQRLADRPEDARFLYLYGRALMGKDTKEALLQLNRAVASAPKLPWTYTALAEIYAARNFRNDTKVVESMRTYRGLCPGNVDGFRYLDKVSEAAEVGEWAKQLRALLARRSESGDGVYWSLLWAAEFRAAPEAEYPAIRRRVATDVKRLEDLATGGNRVVVGALMDGYKLSGQSDLADRIFQRLNPDLEMNKEYDRWIAKTGMRTRTNVTPEERAAFNVEYAKAAGEWVKRWPDSASAWELHLMTLANLPDSSKEEVQKAGLEVLRTEAGRDWGWTYLPLKLRVAQHWLRKGVRPADCVRMAEESLSQILLGPEDPNDMTGSAGGRSYAFDVATWDAMSAVADGSLQLKDLTKAVAMVGRMQRWVDDNRAKKDDPTSGYERFRGRYLHYAGAVAEAQAHTVDAVAFYIESINSGWREPEATKHARELRERSGGTAEGWQNLTRRPPSLPAAAARPAPAPVTAAGTFAAWTEIDRPLPEMNLRDSTGKNWTIADFQGKVTLINVWATWCLPCLDELPELQKLSEMVKDRKDIQVVTLSVDENPGEIEPFLTAKRYTFPVMMLGRAYVEQFIGRLSIPRNWVVDSNGVVRQQSIGFDTKAADWAGAMMKRLVEAR